MPTIHVGAAGFSRPRPRYAQKLNFVEIELRQPLPSPKTLTQWRKELPPDFQFSLVAHAALWGERDWPLRDAEAVQTELDRLTNLAHHLQPRVLVLRTPRAISPNSAAFQRFLTVAERVRKLAPVCVWEPQGVWERDGAQRAVAELGLVVACDPLRDEIVGEDVVYAHMRGLGSDRRYHEGRLTDIAEALVGVTEAFVVFETQAAFAEAVKLSTLIAGGVLEVVAGEDEDEPEDLDEDEDDEDDEDEDLDGDGDEEDEEDGEDENEDEEDLDEDEDGRS